MVNNVSIKVGNGDKGGRKGEDGDAKGINSY